MKTTESVCSRNQVVNEYKIVKTLGQGSFGLVSLVQTDNLRRFAMKAIRKTKIKPGGAKKDITTEMEVLKKLVHRNVIKLHEILDDPSSDDIFLIMDFLEGGTLQDLLQASEAGLQEKNVREYFRQLISAVHYCHEVANIAHRDIKPENMMLDKAGQMILCDFGVSQFFENGTDLLKGTVGSFRFMAPEVVSP